MKELEKHIRVLVTWFNENKIAYALIGGIAVSFRSTERTTKDVDFAIAVDSDEEAERQIHALISIGYQVETLLEQVGTKRLATVRLLRGDQDSVYVDLLFASSGIEKEIVATAETIEVFPDLPIPVASLPALLAMKVLAANDQKRPQDILDIKALLDESSTQDQKETILLLQLIAQRGFSRQKDLLADFEGFIKRFATSG